PGHADARLKLVLQIDDGGTRVVLDVLLVPADAGGERQRRDDGPLVLDEGAVADALGIRHVAAREESGRRVVHAVREEVMAVVDRAAVGTDWRGGRAELVARRRAGLDDELRSARVVR